MTDPWMIAATLTAALLGGGITAATAWFLERKRVVAQENRQRELFVIGVQDDLLHSLGLYDRIQEDYERSNTVWFVTLTEFEQSRYVYTQFPSHLLLLSDPDLRKRIFRYYLRTNEWIGSLRFSQQELYDQISRYQDKLKDIAFRFPDMPHQERIELANQVMADEIQNHDRTRQMLTKEVDKARDFKAEAQELINELRNYG